MNDVRFRTLTCAVAALLVLAPRAHAQDLTGLALPTERRPSDTARGSGPGPSMIITAPGEPDPPPVERERERDLVAASATPPPALALDGPLDPDVYICGRGDVFELNLWGKQNARIRFALDLEGHAFLPKIGPVEIFGQTLTGARATVGKLMAQLYPGLRVQLSLVAPRSFLVHVAEFVTRAGTVRATPLDRVSTVLQAAGGSTGSKRRVLVRRRDGHTIEADLVRYEQTGDTRYNPLVMDGDVVHVPAAELTVTVQGAVQRPGSFELTGSRDLAELIALAGGLRSTATRHLPIRVLGKANGAGLDTSVQSPWPADGALPAVALHDGDRITIPSADELQKSVVLIGPLPGGSNADEVTTVRRLPWFQGATVRALVEGTGGVGSSADLKSAYVRHLDGSLSPVDLDALILRRELAADQPVAVGDTVVVPQRRQAVLVEGAVARPGVYPFNPRFGGPEYVTTAGGPTRMAQSQGAYRVIGADGVARPLARTLKLTPGDTVVVPERNFSRSEVVSLIMGSVGIAVSAAAIFVVAFK